MAKKYYAVKKGREVGVFEKPWEDIKKLVQGFQGASYKGFSNLKEAEDWFSDNPREVVHIKEKRDSLTLVAYVDGSSSMNIDEYGSGVVLIFPDDKVEEISFKGGNEDAKSMKNVAGELSAAMVAMKRAKELGFKKLILCFDYQGIQKWITGEWKCRNEMTRMYKMWYENNIKDSLDISFKWVKGHSGDKYNEIADTLAKRSIGIEV